jgi:hypothetical protein
MYTENILKNENTACRKSDFALQGTSSKPEIRSLKAGVGSLDWGRMKIFWQVLIKIFAAHRRSD